MKWIETDARTAFIEYVNVNHIQILGYTKSSVYAIMTDGEEVTLYHGDDEKTNCKALKDILNDLNDPKISIA